MAMGRERKLQCLPMLLLLLLILQCSGLAVGLYGPTSDVVQLSPSNFKSKVLNAEGIVIVEFFAPWCGHCKSLAPEWEKAATALKGIVTVAAVDADAHQSLAQEYGVKGFPTIKVFGVAKDPVDYSGSREAQGIVDYALGQVKARTQERVSGGSKKRGGSKKSSAKSTPVELNAKNFDKVVLRSTEIWLVGFFAPWCGHCKKLAPEWKTAAEKLKGKVRFGQVDGDAEKGLMTKYDVKGYPTILFFGADKLNPSPYEGGRTAFEIESFALLQVEEHGISPDIVELTGSDVLESHCSSAAICFVAFLPDILDSTAEGRNKYLAVLKAVGDKFKRNAYSYVWAAAGKQAELEKVVDVGGYGYPALVAVNAKKGLYNPLRNAFAVETVVDFVKEAGRGGKGNIPLKGEISVVETEAWDGKDGELIEEDEFSLDDLMATE